MTSKYTISNIHSKMTHFQCFRKRGTRRISAKNDDVNFSRILNFFNDQINLEEIKYEKIIRGMKISFLGSIIFGDHPIGFVRFQNQFEFFPNLRIDQSRTEQKNQNRKKVEQGHFIGQFSKKPAG